MRLQLTFRSSQLEISYPSTGNADEDAQRAASLQIDLNGQWENAADTCLPPYGSGAFSEYNPVSRLYRVEICHFTLFGLFFFTSPVAVIDVAPITTLYDFANSVLVVNGTRSHKGNSTAPVASYAWTIKTPRDDTVVWTAWTVSFPVSYSPVLHPVTP